MRHNQRSHNYEGSWETPENHPLTILKGFSTVSEVLRIQAIVPISTLRQKFWDNKDNETSITDWTLHHLSKPVTRRVQEEVQSRPN